jgi:phage terminase small subunit
MGLTEKQRRFVEAYDGNATEAARLAGYEGDDATLAQVGYENLRKPEIVQAIRAYGDAEREARIATKIQRQKFWTEMMADKRMDPSARLRASELLGKSERDFVERVEHSGPDGKAIPLNVSQLTDEELHKQALEAAKALLESGKPSE